jgi:lipopolysaccharide/colanic/teichoic acid biosynthesis glycosyltransferase
MSERASPRERYPVGWRLKSVIEIPVAALLLVFFSPLFLILCVVVRASSWGPVFYRRRVIGLDGIEFDAFKFRTMVVHADEYLGKDRALRQELEGGRKPREDPRTTSLGRWLRRTSLDELPQLWNVVRGEMSLVGPRMITPSEVPNFGAAAAKRLSVKPGITGLWQVSGRQDLRHEERVVLDVYYVDHWSPWLDLSILLRTIPAVVLMRGAY